MESNPTASQKVAEAHDTGLRELTPEGRLCLFHEVPLKERVMSLLLESPPSIIQKVAEAHDTERRALTPEGTICLFHEVPLKERATAPLELYPTAIQKVEETQET